MDDINPIEEKHFQKFEDECHKDRVLQILSRHIGNDQSYEGAINKAFYKLYQWNAEMLAMHPLDCVILYIRNSWRLK